MPDSLQNTPRQAKRFRDCLLAVRRNGLELRHVPRQMRSDFLVRTAVAQNPLAIKFMLREDLLARPHLLEMALKRAGTLLEWAVAAYPELVNENLCHIAVNSHGSAITAVPRELLSSELLRLAIKRDGSVLTLLTGHEQLFADMAHEIPLKYLPEDLASYDRCLADVTHQGRLLRYVPEAMRDARMVTAALIQNRWAIDYVPPSMQHLPIVQETLDDDSVPESIKGFARGSSLRDKTG